MRPGIRTNSPKTYKFQTAYAKPFRLFCDCCFDGIRNIGKPFMIKFNMASYENLQQRATGDVASLPFPSSPFNISMSSGSELMKAFALVSQLCRIYSIQIC